MFTEEDLDTILEIQGTDGLCGFDTVRGIYRAPDQNLSVFGADVNSDAPTYKVKQSTAAALGLDIGSALSVNDTDFTVSDSKMENTGFVRLSLTRG